MQQLFTLDPFGNIKKNGTSSFLPTYSATTNRFTISGVTIQYDGNGNLLRDNLNTPYTWDPNFGNPANVNGINLTYDALGREVEQQNGSAYTQILYSPAGKTALMNGQTLAKAFISLPGGGAAIFNSTGLAYFRHSDWLGSSCLTSTVARTAYSTSAYAPFGEQYAVSGASDPSFTGQNSDTVSTLYDFLFREDSPSQGRWISPDPAGVAAVDVTNPQSWNRYAYALNNPLNHVDPAGLYCQWDDGSNDSTGDPDTGTKKKCEGLGGNWVADNGVYTEFNPYPDSDDPFTFHANGKGKMDEGNVWGCASEFANKYSIAGGLQALGIGTHGVGGFVTNALGGNVISGATDLISSLGKGESGGHNVFYNMGQGVVAGPTQGFGSAVGKGIKETPWGSGPADVATEVILANAQKIVTGTGQTIQTLNGAVELGTVLGEAGEWATGFGEAKLAYDFLSFAGSLAACSVGIVP